MEDAYTFDEEVDPIYLKSSESLKTQQAKNVSRDDYEDEDDLTNLDEENVTRETMHKNIRDLAQKNRSLTEKIEALERNHLEDEKKIAELERKVFQLEREKAFSPNKCDQGEI